MSGMQITVNRDHLAAGVARAVRAVEKRNTIPILSNILLTATGGELRLRATDLDIEISGRITAQVGTDGATTLPAHTLHDILRKWPEGAELKLEVNPLTGTAVIKSGRSRFALQTLPADDFPDLNAGEPAFNFVLAAEALAGAIKRVQFAISTEETRYYLNGIYLHQTSGEAGTPVLRLVATDGHRLSLAEMPAPEGSAALDGIRGIIIPRKAVGEIRRMAEEAGGDIAISGTSGKLTAEAGGTRLVTKLIDGTYPDYARVIPRGNACSVMLDAAEFAGAVDRVGTVASEKGRAVKFAFAEDRVTRTVTNPDSGEATDEVEAQYQSAPIEIGFNGRYVLDMIANGFGTKGRIELLLADPGSPAMVRAINGDTPATDALCVLMPMRV
jgi:DNA polymerase-3 subunit beta